MKKFFALLVSLLMVLGLVAIPAFAEGETTFTVATVEAAPGEEVTVPVTVTGDFHCHGINLAVEYDASKLTVVKCKGGDLFANRPEDAMVTTDYTTHPGEVIMGGILPTDMWEGEGVLTNITFKVAEDCTENQPLHFNLKEYYVLPIGGDREDLLPTAEIVDGMINVNVPTPVESEEPTPIESEEPTPVESEEPTPVESEEPTPVESEEPTPVESEEPTPVESEEPTPVESEEPTPVESEEPTPVESEEPTPGESEEPVSEEPEQPGETTAPAPGGDTPKPPKTGTASLIGLSIVAVAAGAGIVIFRRKNND